MSRLKKILLSVLWLAVLASAITGYAFYRWATTRLVFPAPIELAIKSGSTLRHVAHQLKREGVPIAPRRFILLGRLLHVSTQLKAGNYELHGALSPYQVLEKVVRGDVHQASMTIIEGWTFQQMRADFDASDALRHDTASWSNTALLAALGVSQVSPEGLFAPDTYLFDKGSSDLDLYRRAYRLMQKRLEAEWANRAPDLPYQTPYEALIMASLIEKETAQASDRNLVAAVFINRLKDHMLLQTDPSVIYGLGEHYDGNLTKKDLLTDGPYNTYTRPGLPPTPIALPGIASIEAALHPADSPALYFVARGDGSSTFSDTLQAHNRAVDEYIRKRVFESKNERDTNHGVEAAQSQ